MEPISAFATAVQLLAVFKSEQKEAEKQTIDDYLEWLRRHEHKQLADGIERNADLTSSLDAFIREGTEEIRQSLKRIESVIIAVASKLPTLQPAVLSVAPSSQLSDQSIEILKGLEECKASGFVTI